MNNGTKLILAFLGGVIVGVAGLAALGRNRLNIEKVKPWMTGLMGKGLVMKDAVMSRVESVKEDLEDMAAEARDQADQARMRESLTEAESTPRN